MATRALPVVGGHESGFGKTKRTDAWWSGPLATIFGLCAGFGYLTWAMLQGDHYFWEPYLSPAYSPVLLVDVSKAGAAPLEHAWFGEFPSWWPWFVPMTPAFLILAFPGSFRMTCYYYRKAYYRAFFGSPPGCAVGPAAPAQKRYTGETALFLFQNLHRYALYFALIFIVILYYDFFLSLKKGGEWGIGVGSVVMFVNATLIAGYTFGCHSFRHLIGGGDDCMSCGQDTMKFGTWKKASWLNARHMLFAWMSLFWVCFTDIYIRLVSMGVIKDLNTWN